MSVGPSAPPAVLARGLTKTYGGAPVVDGIDLTIPAGETFGFLGPNGAGKTSTMRMIYGGSPASGGELRVLGLDLRAQARAVKARLGVAPQEDSLDPDLTVEQNLLVFGRYHGMDRERIAERTDRLLRLVHLADRRKSRINTLSGGMKRRLTLVRALINDPELVVLDEPTTGLDPQARRFVWDLVARLKSGEGKTFLLTTHYMEEAERLCDRLVIMHLGKILAEGAPRRLIAENVGREVITFREEQADRLDAWAAQLTARYSVERHLDELSVGLREGQNVEAVLSEIPSHRFVVRPANLEDVFLKFAGRGLGEETA